MGSIPTRSIIGVYKCKIGLDPHDLRPTYAQLGYKMGIPSSQKYKFLGNSNIPITQLFLILEFDLEVTVSDFIPLE